jgi:hypothetical protein
MHKAPHSSRCSCCLLKITPQVEAEGKTFRGLELYLTSRDSLYSAQNEGRQRKGLLAHKQHPQKKAPQTNKQWVFRGPWEEHNQVKQRINE